MVLKESEVSLAKTVDNFKSEYLNIWWETDGQFPDFGDALTRREQQMKEKDLDNRIGAINSEMENKPATGERNLLWREKIKWAMRGVGGEFMGFKNDSFSDSVIDRFSESADALIGEARQFNPEISMKDINQAIRNLWIANSIQVLLDKEVKLTPSIFAYSMLYPYTDNYLDSSLVSCEEKKTTNSKFGRCLAGEPVVAANAQEDSLFRLVRIIEEEYPRKDSKEVYESLLAIHDAQEKSLLQQGKRALPYETDIIGISFEKGGTSVLADAYLVDKMISFEDLRFMFGYGVFLQLVDDAEDSGADYHNMHMTVFSQLYGKWPLDTITNKLFNFISGVLDLGNRGSPANLHRLKDIIAKNSRFLVFEAIAGNRRAYGREYVKEAEKYSPFSFDYIIKLKKKIRRTLLKSS